MKLGDFNPGELLVDVVIAAAKRIHDRPKAVARRAAKAARKAKRDGPLPDVGEEQFFSDEPKEVPMSDAMQSFLRTILKMIGAALVTKGVLDAGDSATAQVAIEAIIGGVVGLVGIVLSHRTHTAA